MEAFRSRKSELEKINKRKFEDQVKPLERSQDSDF